MTGRMTVRDWFGACFSQIGRDERATNRCTFSEGSARIGELELAPFQQRAVSRGLKIVRTYGGVILADAVGLGKTRVGLAMAAALRRDTRQASGGCAGPIVCCVPARLVAQWREAGIAAGLADIEVISHSALSRGALRTDLRASVVLVDEAHRFRNPNAWRSRRLAQLVARAPLVLMSATPVCNSVWDLYHLFRLFLAEHDLRRAMGHNLKEAFEAASAGDFDLSQLVELLVIRRIEPPSRAGFGRRPDVALEVLSYKASEDEVWLWKNLESTLARLSMELFHHDWPRQLLTEYLLKRWESGADALWASLSEMIDYHRRWLQADAHAHHLSRENFRRLFGAEARAAFEQSAASGFECAALGARQAVFPFFYDFSQRSGHVSRETLPSFERKKVVQDLAQLRELHRIVEMVAHHGDDKRRAILQLIERDAHKVLIFTSYQQAARGLYDYLVRSLGARARVGLVTGEGAWATGLGRTRADELVRRFCPRANGVRDMPEHQQIDVLIGTDCLSEGVNLQDCSRVVLADLPYSPLGVEQRIGRLLRPGAPAAVATVYLPRPDCWADSLGLRRRLDRKMSQAAHAGADFVAARPLRRPAAEPDIAATNALAALTRLDALSQSLCMGAQEKMRGIEGFWRARTRRGPRRLWVKVAMHEANTSRIFWCLASCGAPATMRLSVLINTMVEDANETSSVASIRREEIDAALYRSAREAIGRRASLLRSARLAPYPLRLDAPQRRIWAELAGAIESRALKMNREALCELRHDLLRSFPRGVERRLEQLAQRRMPPQRRLERVRQIMGPVPRWSPEIELNIVACLELIPENHSG